MRDWRERERMTRRELESIRKIELEQKRWERKLRTLNSASEVKSPQITGMPRGNDVGNPVERMVILKSQYEDIIKGKLAEIQVLRHEIEEFINNIDDYFIRSIIEYKWLDLMSWNEVAIAIGGPNTEGSVKMAYHRFLKKSGIK